MDSQLGIGFGFLEVGEERGGVTGQLLEIRSGGRDEGIELRRNGKREDGLLTSIREGLGKDDDEGLTW